jgi:hypothetical protein
VNSGKRDNPGCGDTIGCYRSSSVTGRECFILMTFTFVDLLWLIRHCTA